MICPKTANTCNQLWHVRSSQGWRWQASQKGLFYPTFPQGSPRLIPRREFFTAFASVAVKTSHEMVLLSKQPISSPVVRCPSAELPVWASTGRAALEGKPGRAHTASSPQTAWVSSQVKLLLPPETADALQQCCLLCWNPRGDAGLAEEESQPCF